MTKPSTAVQQALSAALLATLKSPDLSPEDAEWVQQFALRTISEFNLAKDEKDSNERPIAA